MDLSKVSAMTESKTYRDLTESLGSQTFTREFICAYSSVVASLTALLQGKPKKPHRSEAAQMAFKQLKQSFTTTHILRHLDPDLPFIIKLMHHAAG